MPLHFPRRHDALLQRHEERFASGCLGHQEAPRVRDFLMFLHSQMSPLALHPSLSRNNPEYLLYSWSKYLQVLPSLSVGEEDVTLRSIVFGDLCSILTNARVWVSIEDVVIILLATKSRNR
jgi:hypothetical protein